MTQLSSFTKSIFSNWGIFQLLSDLKHHLDSETDELLKAFIAKRLADFDKAFADFDKALIAAKTAEAPANYDEKRDWAVKEIYQIAHVYDDYFLDEAKQAASHHVLNIFKRYGTGTQMAQLAQDKESAAITNLLQDLKADAAKPHIAKLDLDKLITYLEENNEAFIATRRLVTQENMELAGLVKINRTASEEAWDKLRSAINGFVAANDDESDSHSLIDDMNATIEHHKSAIKRSRSGKSGDEEAPNPPQE